MDQLSLRPSLVPAFVFVAILFLGVALGVGCMSGVDVLRVCVQLGVGAAWGGIDCLAVVLDWCGGPGGLLAGSCLLALGYAIEGSYRVPRAKAFGW